jgi:hypothetical protein
VAYRPVDLQGVSTVTGNASESVTDPAASALGGDSGAAAGGTTPSSGTTPDPSNPSATADGATTTADTETGGSVGAGSYTAGLYGDQYSVTFEMSRLPRLDEYSPIVIANGLQPAVTQIPTDIRTISYYLSGSVPMTQAAAAQSRQTGIDTSLLNPQQNALEPLEGKGLIRQERDRSVASYSSVAVDFSDPTQDTGEELLAEEVTRLEFQYFDGYQWWPSWDSDVRGGLPMAIEIIIGMPDRKLTGNEPAPSLVTSQDAAAMPQELTYRLVVRIPTAEPLDPATAGMSEEEPPAEGEAAGGGSTASPMPAAPSALGGGS